MVDVLLAKTADAAREYGVGRVCVCGGVAANKALRAAVAERLPVPASIPPFFLCTDNAAMIGAAAHYRLLSDGPTALDFDVEPDLGLEVERRLVDWWKTTRCEQETQCARSPIY